MNITVCFLILASAFGFTYSTEVICYFTNWAIYREGIANFKASDIDPNLCTIINYGFVGLWGDSGELRVLDPYSDYDLGNLKGVISLKKQNPHLKVIVSMGGWNEGSRNYSVVAGNVTLRNTFIKSVLSYLKKNHLDGFDLDWEYPTARNGKPEDVENFVTLLCELKKAFKPKGYYLSIAVAGTGYQVDASYDISGIMKCVDYMNIMSYDFRTPSSPSYTGHHSPLYPSSKDIARGEEQLSVSRGIQQWLKKGAKPSKMTLGLPFYADSFNLVNPAVHGLYAPADGPAQPGPLTGEAGTYSYQEICYSFGNYTHVWDDELQAPYAYQNTTWFGYDNPRSIRLKTQYALDNGLAGVMIWALDLDDFNGSCKDGKYPLLRAVVDTINEHHRMN